MLCGLGVPSLRSLWGAVLNRQLYILRMCCKRCNSFNFSRLTEKKDYMHLPQKQIHDLTFFLYMSYILHLCGTVRGSFTLSLFSSRSRQITDERMQCIVNFACLQHVHDTHHDLCMLAYIPKPWATHSKQLTGHEFCIVRTVSVCPVVVSIPPLHGGGSRARSLYVTPPPSPPPPRVLGDSGLGHGANGAPPFFVNTSFSSRH